MAESMKEELDIKEIDIKDKIKEEICPFSTVEETCTVYVQEEDVKIENTEIKGKQ